MIHVPIISTPEWVEKFLAGILQRQAAGARWRRTVLIDDEMAAGGIMESLVDHQRVQRFVLATVFEELLSLQQEISRAADVNVEVTVYPHLGLGGVEFLVHHERALADERRAQFIFMAFAYVDGNSARCGFELWPATVGGKWPRLHSGEIALYDADATVRDREIVLVQEFVRNRVVTALRAWRHHPEHAHNR